MDEGFNTFIDVYESDDFENGVYGPKRDGEYAPDAKGGTPADQIAALIKDPEAPVILSRGDTIREKYRHPVTYFKAAFGLTLLREDILGPERFDPAFRKYIADWAYKHPKPSDFFREMESAGGEDLSYFWRGYFLNNWSHDLAVTDVTNDAAKGASVTVENRLDQLVLPATLRVVFKDGGKKDIRIPVETWMQTGKHTYAIDGGPVAEATVDPDHRLPDADRSNNSMKAKWSSDRPDHARRRASAGEAPSRWIACQTAKNSSGQRTPGAAPAVKAAAASGFTRRTASTSPRRPAMSAARGAIQASTGTVKPCFRAQGSAAGQCRSSHLRSIHLP